MTLHHVSALNTGAQASRMRAPVSCHTVLLQAALCTAVGGVGSYVYMAWLCYNIDCITPDDEIPMMKANNIRDAWVRWFARVFAGLLQQLQPRLLVRLLVPH
jgi:hypothetical protein